MEPLAAIVLTASSLILGLAIGLWYARRHFRPSLAESADHVSLLRAEDAGALLSSLSIALVVLDSDDAVVVANPAAQQLGLLNGVGLASDELMAAVHEVRVTGGRPKLSLELPSPTASQPVLSVLVRSMRLTGGRVLLLVEDRSAAQRVEAVRRDFVVNVSHELKTPVGALSLLAQTLQEAAEDPEAVRHFAASMETETSRLTELVQDIIDLSRAQIGSHQEFTVESVDSLLAEAVEQAATPASAKDIAITVPRLAPSGPVAAQLWVRCDRTSLVTAIRNLLDNAVTYSDKGTEVRVEVVAEETMVAIAVIDRGIGIPPEAQSRIFERFYRVDPARSRLTGGTGLGLSIVKHIAAEHRGDVTLRSAPGHGSTFTLRLPLAPAAKPSDGDAP
ncbi:MAG TPA: ATP-binding protein [Actinomycetaceae bacterium]|nr:ATP-binding protein [Actinomycetaceae bacterium]